MKPLRWTTHDTTRFQTLMRAWGEKGDWPEELERLSRKLRGRIYQSMSHQQIRRRRRIRRQTDYVCRPSTTSSPNT